MTNFIARLKRLRQTDKAVAAHVRAVLVTSLYASPASLVIGALTSSAIALVVAITAGDRWIAACALLIGLVAAMRIIAVLRPASHQVEQEEHRQAGTDRWELYYRLGAYAYSALLGLLGLLTLTRTDQGVLQLLAVTTAIGYAAGIAARNAGRPWIALWQLCLASLPLAVGLLLSFEPLKMVLAVVILLFVVAMMEITLLTYQVILSATLATGEKAALAEHHAALARRDDLTGVANRTAFRELFEERLQEVRATGRALSISWLDLDRFKEVNDSFGHHTGNLLLAGIAHRLETAFGTDGVVARLGGDEFAVVNFIAGETEATAIGDRILDLVSQPVDCEGRHLRVRASLGVAVAPADGSDADTLLKHADLALYRAKEGGRGTLRFYEPLMDEKIERSRMLAADLHGALERGEFRLLFQPIFDLGTRRVLSCEALLRWERQGEAIPPDEFIPLAEDSGLIVGIGAWVLREACRVASSWPADVRVAVNLSPIQLLSPNLPAILVSALGASGLPAERLELEVTESVLLEDVEASLGVLDTINRMNVRTTLDDFGTGYSSLSYLTRFPFETLKIDRSFIADLDKSPASMAIVQTVIELATTLNMETVAEGVETRIQLDQLRRTRCAAAQGYFLARPMPANMVDAMFAGTVPVAQARA